MGKSKEGTEGTYLIFDLLDLGRIARFERFDSLDIDGGSLAVVNAKQRIHRECLYDGDQAMPIMAAAAQTA